MCDFKVRQNTNVHRYTVQCVLPINLFNEKIFTLVWFWLCIVSVITAGGLISWLYQLAYWPTQYRYVRRQLTVSGLVEQDPPEVKRFADAYLRRDGLFVLRLVAKNAGELVSTELLSGLWEAYSLKQRSLQLAAIVGGAGQTTIPRPWRKAPKLPKIITGRGKNSASKDDECMSTNTPGASSVHVEMKDV